jgi:riboflavin synthase
MFTGIIEETGRVRSFVEQSQAWRLVIEAHEVLKQLNIGDSIAVNGCCLTAVAFDAETVSFDLLSETVRLTGFSQLRTGGVVNLERSLSFGGKMGGHFVTGHVDAQGVVEVIEPRGKDYYIRVAVPTEFLTYLVYKGSIAIDGISLTVAEVHPNGFAVWLIPHTMTATNLHTRNSGDSVNLEFDILAKYIEKMMPGNREIPRS